MLLSLFQTLGGLGMGDAICLDAAAVRLCEVAVMLRNLDVVRTDDEYAAALIALENATTVIAEVWESTL
jgi:hypothetical protein